MSASKTAITELSLPQYEMFIGHRKISSKRVYAKGRRLGATLGAMRWVVLSLLSRSGPFLWVETQYSDIKRYRYLYLDPFLNELKIKHSWDGGLNRLMIYDQYADFRSSQNPKALEGQKYRRVFLNEAGIILKNGGVADGEYLVENAILPMTWNYDDSEIVIAGTPKSNNYFKTLYDRGQARTGGWYSKTYTSYDVPSKYLNHENLREYEATHTPYEVRQEIYGEFVDDAEQVVKSEWIVKRDVVPDKLRIVLGLDVASTTHKTSDRSAAVVLGFDDDNDIVYVLAAYASKHEFADLLKWIVDIADKHHPEVIAVETNGFQVAVATELKRTTSYKIISKVSKTDKMTRLFPVAAKYSQRKVIHLSSISPDFERELLSFAANSVHDDYPDALSIAYNVGVVRATTKPTLMFFDPFEEPHGETK